MSITYAVSVVNPFAIPSNCNKNNPSPAYPALKALSLYFFEEEEKKQGVSFTEWQEREHLAYAALEEFFTNTLGGDKEEMLGIFDSYVEDNNIWSLYDEFGDGGIGDFTGFDEFAMFHGLDDVPEDYI